MYDPISRLSEPQPRQLAADPGHLAAFIEAWEAARISYADVLRGGVDRSDIELARDHAYRRLLDADLQIHRLGGTDAVRVVSESLEMRMSQAGSCHFKRLWSGLVPGRGH
ncbi:hypothetical protein [Frigidibacter mobilis]|uniref:hypothetical protein n=1 Tax=Frigidibacter mobilis TaxID=1335048 RepID=UPI001411DE5D|nr:hypothetical protein [Frigidibacter mobilis]